MRPTTVSAALRRMAGRRHSVQHDNPDDGRSYLVGLSPAGPGCTRGCRGAVLRRAWGGRSGAAAGRVRAAHRAPAARRRTARVPPDSTHGPTGSPPGAMRHVAAVYTGWPLTPAQERRAGLRAVRAGTTGRHDRPGATTREDDVIRPSPTEDPTPSPRPAPTKMLGRWRRRSTRDGRGPCPRPHPCRCAPRSAAPHRRLRLRRPGRAAAVDPADAALVVLDVEDRDGDRRDAAWPNGVSSTSTLPIRHYVDGYPRGAVAPEPTVGQLLNHTAGLAEPGARPVGAAGRTRRRRTRPRSSPAGCGATAARSTRSAARRATRTSGSSCSPRRWPSPPNEPFEDDRDRDGARPGRHDLDRLRTGEPAPGRHRLRPGAPAPRPGPAGGVAGRYRWRQGRRSAGVPPVPGGWCGVRRPGRRRRRRRPVGGAAPRGWRARRPPRPEPRGGAAHAHDRHARASRSTSGSAGSARPRNGTPSPAFVEHLGSGGGYCNVLRIYPELDLGVAIMANTTRSYDHHAICTAAATTAWA